MKDTHGRTALVTGASGGIGAAFAEILAERGCHLILVARTEEKLAEVQQRLAENFPVAVEILAMDLSQHDSADQLLGVAKSKGWVVDFLINNAGLGSTGSFLETEWARDEAMIDLNIRAVTRLTKLFLKEMMARGSGHILNVASLTGFQPVPGFAGYSGTKAFVLNFSEAVNLELSGTGVHVTALCPGTTRTQFWERAGSRGNWIRNLTSMDSRTVAAYGVRLMLRGRPSGIPGLFNRLLVLGNRFVPRRWSAMLGAYIMKE